MPGVVCRGTAAWVSRIVQCGNVSGRTIASFDVSVAEQLAVRRSQKMPHLSQEHLKNAKNLPRRFESRQGTAVFEQLKAQLTKSLRELCAKRGSINVVCRDLNINRQQFAKYLSGTNLPSTFVIQRLALYFAVDPSIFFTDSHRRHRNLNGGAIRLEASPDLAEGFYLEHTLCSSDCLAVGLWRFDRYDSRMYCHGEVPRARDGHKSSFESFSGQIASSQRQQQLIASSQCGSNSVILALKPFELGGNDLIAVRTTLLAKDDVLQSTPSLLRYIGTKIDIAKCLTTQCGLMKLSELDERSAKIVEMLSSRVSPHASGFKLTS